MTLGELIAYARGQADDSAAGEMWTQAEWISHANEAEREACRRARLIVDSTSAITKITISADKTSVVLDPRILFIRRARLIEPARFLGRVSHHDLDCRSASWEDDRGTPQAYVPDLDTQRFRPYPVPDADCVVRLTVVRLPLADMVEAGSAPEIAPHLHRSLANWMLYRAHSKQDGEAVNLKKAAEYLAEFEQEFGRKSSAIDEAWLQREHEYLPAEGNF